jgi:cytochrome c-type biogenesis protein CcmF
VVVTLIAALAGFTKPVSLVGFALSGLAATTVVLAFGEATVRRSRATGMAPLNALWSLMRQQRRRYGGYMVHLGVVLMAVGVIGTRMYPFEGEVVLAPGETQAIGGYELTLNTVSREQGKDYISTVASVGVSRDGAHITTLMPRVNQYQTYDQLYSVPAIQPTLCEDVYLILGGWGTGGSSATLKVVVNTLASFLWLGGLVFLAGGALALWPPQQRQVWRWVTGIVLAALLAGAAWAMWGAPTGIDRGLSGGAGARRPGVGQAAPDFRLSLLDGTSLALSDLTGKITVLNFWAPWCPSCKDNLPLLVDVWWEYREQDVVVIGVAYDTEMAAVVEAIAAYDIAYPIGLDGGDRGGQRHRISRAYGITGVPETFIIDADGIVTYMHIGPIASEQLIPELEALLGEP